MCGFVLECGFDGYFLAWRFDLPLRSFLVLKICVLDYIEGFMGLPRFFGIQRGSARKRVSFQGCAIFERSYSSRPPF